MRTEIIEIIQKIRKESGMEEVPEIQDSMRLKDDLDIDSISMAQLIAEIDQKYDVDINAIGPLQTFGEIISRLS